MKSDTSRGGQDLWFVRFHKNTTEVLWDKTFGGRSDETAPSIIEYDTGHYLVVCASSSVVSGDITEVGKGASDVVIIKLRDQSVPKNCLLRWWKKVCKN